MPNSLKKLLGTTALAALLLFPSCHDQIGTESLKKDLSAADARLESTTREIQKANSDCQALGQEAGVLAGQRSAAQANAASSKVTRDQLSTYRGAVEKDLGQFAADLESYKTKYLKP